MLKGINGVSTTPAFWTGRYNPAASGTRGPEGPAPQFGTSGALLQNADIVRCPVPLDEIYPSGRSVPGMSFDAHFDAGVNPPDLNNYLRSIGVGGTATSTLLDAQLNRVAVAGKRALLLLSKPRLETHAGHLKDGTYATQENVPLASSLGLWAGACAYLAERYANNPVVPWIEILNEPDAGGDGVALVQQPKVPPGVTLGQWIAIYIHKCVMAVQGIAGRPDLMGPAFIHANSNATVDLLTYLDRIWQSSGSWHVGGVTVRGMGRSGHWNNDKSLGTFHWSQHFYKDMEETPLSRGGNGLPVFDPNTQDTIRNLVNFGWHDQVAGKPQVYLTEGAFHQAWGYNNTGYYSLTSLTATVTNGSNVLRNVSSFAGMGAGYGSDGGQNVYLADYPSIPSGTIVGAIDPGSGTVTMVNQNGQPAYASLPAPPSGPVPPPTPQQVRIYDLNGPQGSGSYAFPATLASWDTTVSGILAEFMGWCRGTTPAYCGSTGGGYIALVTFYQPIGKWQTQNYLPLYRPGPYLANGQWYFQPTNQLYTWLNS